VKSTKIHKLSRHEERPEAEQPTIYVLLHHLDVGMTLIHGAYSTEDKVVAELERLAKEPQNRLTKKQKAKNVKDPMDAYSIREVAVL
jgi:hypothetical protein